MITNNHECQIVQVDVDTNAFVMTKDFKEVFRISFHNSIIRKFIQTTHGYILHFQCRSLVNREKGNVCLISYDGNISWWAKRKRPEDCYVELNVTDDSIIGYDGSYNCYIDINTGKIQKREFVK